MSEMTREEVHKFLGKLRSNGATPDAPLLDHDAAQRATIAEQAERIARLELELDAWQRADYRSTETLHDKYATAALTGFLSFYGRQPDDQIPSIVAEARCYADEAMKQRARE